MSVRLSCLEGRCLFIAGEISCVCMERKIRIFLVLLVVFGLLFAVPVMADHDGDSEEADEVSRSVEIERDDTSIEIELEREDGHGDGLEISFDQEKAEFEVEYSSEANATEVENKLEASFQLLAEYRDGNGNGQYDVGEEIVSAWQLSEEDEDDFEDVERERVSWQSLVIEDETVDGRTGKKITSTASMGDGEVTLTAHVFGNFVNLGESSLKPTDVKLDIGVEEYPFQAEDTALTLFVDTETSREIEAEDDEDIEDDEEAVSSSILRDNREISLVFSWKKTAQADGVRADVATTLIKEGMESEVDSDESEIEHERVFTFSYPRASSILHDPRISMNVSPVSGRVPTSAWIGLALAVLVGVFAVKRFWQ